MSKKIFTAVVLILYTSLVIRTFLPVLYYAVNYNYIVTQLCVQREDPDNLCKGSCFLNETIKKQFEDRQKKQSTSIITFANLFIPHVGESDETDFIEPIKNITYFLYKEPLTEQFVTPSTPPPRYLLSV